MELDFSDIDDKFVGFRMQPREIAGYEATVEAVKFKDFVKPYLKGARTYEDVFNRVEDDLVGMVRNLKAIARGEKEFSKKKGLGQSMLQGRIERALPLICGYLPDRKVRTIDEMIRQT